MDAHNAECGFIENAQNLLVRKRQKKKQSSFRCDKCKSEKEKSNKENKDRSNDDKVTSKHVLNQLKSDMNTLTNNSWFRDTHMDRVLKDLQKEELKNGERILFMDPVVTQLLKFAPAEEVDGFGG